MLGCIQIKGRVFDYATHKPIAMAKLVAQTANGSVPVAISRDSGEFSGIIPCGTTALLIKRADYRNQSISIQLPKNIGMKTIVSLIPLIPVDKQNIDTPYLQTEQTNYVQADGYTTNQSASDNNRIQHDKFLVTDAIQKRPLSATICFFFTKSGKKQCLETNSEGWFQTDFKQKDIIALEVNAEGYLPYAGNMLIEQLDGRSLVHEIKLQRELTLYTVDAPNATKCELRSKTNVIKLTRVRGYKDQYVAYDLVPGSFELIVSYQTQKVKQTIQLHSGLNFITVPQPRTGSLVETASIEAPSYRIASGEAITKTPLNLPDSIPMIYFEQGSYELRSDSQGVLRQVVEYLKVHPTNILMITGHTDNVGNPQVNQTLSMYRARATANFLVRYGITENRLIKDGIGSSQPLMPNTTETNRVLNRRVSLKLITTKCEKFT